MAQRIFNDIEGLCVVSYDENHKLHLSLPDGSKIPNIKEHSLNLEITKEGLFELNLTLFVNLKLNCHEDK